MSVMHEAAESKSSRARGRADQASARCGTVIRGLEAEDIEPIARYWHDATPEFLEKMNVDPRKLVSIDATRSVFQLALQPVAEAGRRAVFVVTIGEALVAYSNLNFWSPSEGAAHVHVIDPTARSKGLASLLFEPMVMIYISEFRLRRIVFETSPRNDAVNRFLAKVGLVPTERYLERPDGMAKAGTFLVYEITADQLRERAARRVPA